MRVAWLKVVVFLSLPCAAPAAQGPPVAGDPALVGLDHHGGEPYVVSVGDVDGDGVPDLLVQLGYLWQSPARLDLLRGRGDGSFQPAEPALDLSTAPGFGFTRLVDADADGRLDVLMVIAGTDQSRLYLGLGDGSFQPPIVVPGRNWMWKADCFATADFDLDGRQDFVVTGQTGSAPGGTLQTTVFVYLGGPGGAYAGPQGGSIGFYTGLGALTTGDFDADGLPDVLASVSPVSSFLPPAGLWMFPGNGAGGLGAPVVTPLDTLPCSLVTEDFDGDGRLDVAAFDAMPGTLQPAVRLLLGDGTGRFTMAGWLIVAAPTEFANAFGSRLLKADVDADGLTDLVAVPEVSTTLSLFRGLGGGQFAPATTHPIGDATSPGWYWRHAETADLDGDGRGDLVVSHVLQGTFRTLLAGTAPFVQLGLGQPDTQQAPVLSGSGSTLPGGAVQIDLSGVPPGTQGLLLIDLATSVQPALGLQVALPQGQALPVAGDTTLLAPWPDHLVPGMPVYVQAVLAGPTGYSTSNVLAIVGG